MRCISKTGRFSAKSKLYVMKKLLVIIPFLLLGFALMAQNYPREHWEKITDLEEYEFSKEHFEELSSFISDKLETASCLVVYKGKILYSYGQIEETFLLRSARKSLMSTLYGIYVEKGLIDPELTLAELNITDILQPDSLEGTATIRDCLMARSGVYLPAEAESAVMQAFKPERGAYKPGEHWCYNNWDFNVLSTILTNLTGKGFFQSFDHEIARETGMEHFNAYDCFYLQGRKSIHPAYHMYISASDLARFGLLMLNRGKWEDKQILSTDWVDLITTPHSDASEWGTDGYAYMWWVRDPESSNNHFPIAELPEGSYSARGGLGQFLVVIPEYDLIIVHQTENAESRKQVSENAMGYVINKILQATNNPYHEIPAIAPDKEITGRYQLRANIYLTFTEEDNKLYVSRTGLDSKEELIPYSGNVYLALKNALQFTFYDDSDEGRYVEMKQLSRITRAMKAEY